MRRSMKAKISAAMVVLLLLLPGCGAGASPSSPPPSETLEPSSSPAPSAADADPNARVPLEDWIYMGSFSDPLSEETPQLVCKDDTAARLARAIRPLEWLLSTVEPPYFDSDHPLDADTAARIAFDNTRRLDPFSFNDHPDDPAVKRIAQLREDGAVVCDVIYADDAAAALEQLFGVTGWEHHTVDYYNYFPEEGIYVTYGDIIRGTSYPQLLSWEETGTGYSCEVIVINPRFDTVGDGIQVNEENIQEMAALVPHYTFTFDMATGEPVVTAFAKSREGLTDKAQPLVDDYMWSGTPKAQAVGPITTATLHREIPQYTYRDGVLTPYEGSHDYPVSAGGEVFGIFRDIHDSELGNSQSFSSEYAEALVDFAEENDQLCIVYDDLGGWFFSPDARKLFQYGPDFTEEKLRDPGSFQNAQIDISGIEFYPTQHTPSFGGLYFDLEAWAENWAS